MHRSLSLLALAACGSAAHPAPPRTLVAVSHVEHLDVAAREPAVVQHPSGRLFVAAYSRADSHPHLWQSDDRGTTWTPVALGDAAAGNSDVDLAVGPDGTLYYANLTFDRDAMQGKSVAIAASHDAGATWTWTTLSTQPLDDRPWIAIATDGSAHVIWSNEGGVHHAISRDHGATWHEDKPIAVRGGSSHLVAGPHGLLAARVTPAWGGGAKLTLGIDKIVISRDNGATWASVPAPGERLWKQPDDEDSSEAMHWVEPLAFDPDGDLYSIWTGDHGVHVARTHDLGKTWSQMLVATGDVFFPYAIATGSGELAMTWFTSSKPGTNDLRWHIARLAGGNFSEAPPQPLECTRGSAQDTCGEYLMPVELAGGQLGLAAPIQHDARGGFTFWTFEAR